jgi:hypothetical protein
LQTCEMTECTDWACDSFTMHADPLLVCTALSTWSTKHTNKSAPPPPVTSSKRHYTEQHTCFLYGSSELKPLPADRLALVGPFFILPLPTHKL